MRWFLVGRFLRVLYSNTEGVDRRARLISACERLSKRAAKDANQRTGRISGETAFRNARRIRCSISSNGTRASCLAAAALTGDGQWCPPNDSAS